jgi:LPS sulfotransferase NodH
VEDNANALLRGIGQDSTVAEPLSSYLVCASQRSGTTMLCRALADTGIAGAPDEYFLAIAEEAAPQAEPVYDPTLIRNLLGLIEDGERGWRGLFTELGIDAYEVTSEDLATDEGYTRALHGILAYLGLDASTTAAPARRTHRRSDALNEEWVERYLAEPGPGTST